MPDDYEEDYCDASDCDSCEDDDCAPIRVPPPRPGGQWVPNFGKPEDVRLIISETALALNNESDTVIIPDLRTMSMQDKIIVKSLGLAYVRPYGGRCTLVGCEKRACWYESGTRSWGCTFDHIKKQLKEASAERPEKKKQSLNDYMQQLRSTDWGQPETNNQFYWTTATGTTTVSAQADTQTDNRIYGQFMQTDADGNTVPITSARQIRLGRAVGAGGNGPSQNESDIMETALRPTLATRPHLRERIWREYTGSMGTWVEAARRIIAEDDGADEPSSPNNS